MAAGDEVFLTGASGFVGAHVLEALLAAGYRVRALVRGDAAGLGGDRVTTVVGDLTRPGELAAELRGCRYLVHVAAVYSFHPRDRRRMWEVNVRGTAGLLEAARIAGIEKAVVTSSSATVGPAGAAGPATEEDVRPPAERSHGYHDSKAAQERVALAAQLPVVLVLPTAPVGPGDRRPTPTGQIVLDYMRGRIFATVPGGMNLVPVEDAARAHVLALERGRAGERYLVGGEDLSFDDIWATLAEHTGRRPPRLTLPAWAPVALGLLDDLRCRLIPGSRPRVPLEGARMAGLRMYASSRKAAEELGYRPGSAAAALGRAVRWYREAGLAA
jgi:dihydroflavonol-4-reductase